MYKNLRPSFKSKVKLDRNELTRSKQKNKQKWTSKDPWRIPLYNLLDPIVKSIPKIRPRHNWVTGQLFQEYHVIPCSPFFRPPELSFECNFTLGPIRRMIGVLEPVSSIWTTRSVPKHLFLLTIPVSVRTIGSQKIERWLTDIYKRKQNRSKGCCGRGRVEPPKVLERRDWNISPRLWLRPNTVETPGKRDPYLWPWVCFPFSQLPFFDEKFVNVSLK